MRYKKFRIKNFKGIKDATLDLSSSTGANVFTLVGLNESGKTTLLEAIHSFSPDARSGKMVKKLNEVVDYEGIVPRHLYSIFTGNVSVEATIVASKDDKELIARDISEDFDLDPEGFDEDLIASLETKFSRGDFVETYRYFSGNAKVKNKGARKWRAPTEAERRIIAHEIYRCTPNIAYYPTFIFDFPDKIWLTNRGNSTSRFYKEVFEDILAYDGQGFSIQKDIIERVRGKSLVLPWMDFLAKWQDESSKSKIRHIIDRAQKVVTKVVFSKWDQLFGETAGDREVYIEFEIDEGKVRGANGQMVPTHSHDPYIIFQIKDGTRRFNVDDRSLGFRWFFAFLLFTQFRTASTGDLPTLFLFDEPAANLHAAAQQQLIGGFPEIARGDNMLIYSTHSHYMIEPKWLEQTFIVTNRSDAPVKTVIDAAVLDDESLDIKAEVYKQFVQKHNAKTSYFQPILDRLNVVPSRFDMLLPSVILEGKSDYYILRYIECLLSRDELRLIPGLGAGTFGALIALSVGWGSKFLFMLDSDVKGVEERDRYVSELGVPDNAMVTIGELLPGIKEIEDIFDEEALSVVRQVLGVSGKISKKHLLRFSQEQLAKGSVIPLGDRFSELGGEVLECLKVRLAAL